MSTEAEVKAAVRALLDKHAPHVYYEMHVPYGYGKSGLDFNVVVWGRALYIEAKRPGKYPTALQRSKLVAAWHAGAACFIISNIEGVLALGRWLDWQDVRGYAEMASREMMKR